MTKKRFASRLSSHPRRWPLFMLLFFPGRRHSDPVTKSCLLARKGGSASNGKAQKTTCCYTFYDNKFNERRAPQNNIYKPTSAEGSMSTLRTRPEWTASSRRRRPPRRARQPDPS